MSSPSADPKPEAEAQGRSKTNGDKMISNDKALTTTIVAGIAQILQQAFPSMIISENKPAPSLNQALDTMEVLYWVLLPQGETARLTFPRMVSATTGMTWMSPTSNLILDILSPGIIELWRLIAVVDHHTLSNLDNFDALVTQYGGHNVTEISAVLASQVPATSFNSPPYAHCRLNDLIFHYMNCKIDFLSAQPKLTADQMEQLDDFLWNINDDTSKSLNELLQLSIQLNLQCSHVHGFLYILFFHKCHPFVTPENTFELFAFLEKEKKEMKNMPLLEAHQIEMVDQARLGSATGGEGSATITITELSKQVGLPKRMVFYMLTALQTDETVAYLPDAQYLCVKTYKEATTKTILSSTTDLDQKPSAVQAPVETSDTATTKDVTMGDVPTDEYANASKKRAHLTDDTKHQQPTKQTKLMESKQHAEVNDTNDTTDSTSIAAPQNDCHETAINEQSAGNNTSDRATTAMPDENTMPLPGDMKKSAAASTKARRGASRKKNEKNKSNLSEATGDNRSVTQMQVENDDKGAEHSQSTKMGLLDLSVLVFFFLVAFFFIVANIVDWTASTSFFGKSTITPPEAGVSSMPDAMDT